MAGLKILIVEDDWMISKDLSFSLQDLGFEVVGTFDTGEEALKKYKELEPDVVLLDIHLAADVNGIEVGKKLQEEKIPFIFLTALADRETIDKAKLVEPFAYLVKPVSKESLYSTIEIALHKAGRNMAIQESSPPLQENLSIDDGIFIKANKRLEKIQLRDVLYIEAHDIYAMIYTEKDKYLLSTSLKTVEEKFPSGKFMRCHRSFIVNISKIDAIEESDLIINNRRIPVGKTYKDKIMNRLSFF